MNEIAKDILIAPFDSPVILVLSLLYAIYESIRVYDARLLQVKTMGLCSAVAAEAHGRTLPRWVGAIHLVGIILLIVLLILNWKYAIALYALLFLLRVVPVLERIGATMMGPFLEEEPTPSEAEQVYEHKRRLEFMKSHKEIVMARLSQYLDEDPDVDGNDIPTEVWDPVFDECLLDYQKKR